MDVVGVAGRLAKLYFWVLAAGALAAVVWLADRFLVDVGVTATGWLAVAGLLALVAVLMAAFRRAVR